MPLISSKTQSMMVKALDIHYLSMYRVVDYPLSFPHFPCMGQTKRVLL